jgi:hypothetical protein
MSQATLGRQFRKRQGIWELTPRPSHSDVQLDTQWTFHLRIGHGMSTPVCLTIVSTFPGPPPSAVHATRRDVRNVFPSQR